MKKKLLIISLACIIIFCSIGMFYINPLIRKYNCYRTDMELIIEIDYAEQNIYEYFEKVKDVKTYGEFVQSEEYDKYVQRLEEIYSEYEQMEKDYNVTYTILNKQKDKINKIKKMRDEGAWAADMLKGAHSSIELGMDGSTNVDIMGLDIIIEFGMDKTDTIKYDENILEKFKIWDVNNYIDPYIIFH